MAKKEKMTQAQAVEWIAEKAGFTKKEVKTVLEGVVDLAQYQLGSGGPGEQILPILGIKLKVVKTPKKPARRGINPFTGEEQIFKAKPAGKKLKVQAMKKLKDAVL